MKIVFGTPRGSPISAMLADLDLQDLEEIVLTKLSFKVHSYYRYVDDTKKYQVDTRKKQYSCSTYTGI